MILLKVYHYIFYCKGDARPLHKVITSKCANFFTGFYIHAIKSTDAAINKTEKLAHLNISLSLCEENNEKSNASISHSDFSTTIGSHPSRAQIKISISILRRPKRIFRRAQRSDSTVVRCCPRSGHLTNKDYIS